MACRYVALDVHYGGVRAVASGITFSSWESPAEDGPYIAKLDGIADYIPGQFYLRELPCLKRVLRQIGEPITTVVIDGYVTLGKDRRPGLGMYLWQSLRAKIPIIGVAKSRFHSTPVEARIFRDDSYQPLYISSVGVALEEAKWCIQRMHGKHRLPTLLKRVDQLSRMG
jgi:deoxyribonuclease V